MRPKVAHVQKGNMRKIISLLIFLLWCSSFIVGCKTIEKGIQYYEACNGDSKCIEESQRIARISETITKTAMARRGQDSVISGTIASGIGFLTALGTMIWLGRKKMK